MSWLARLLYLIVGFVFMLYSECLDTFSIVYIIYYIIYYCVI